MWACVNEWQPGGLQGTRGSARRGVLAAARRPLQARSRPAHERPRSACTRLQQRAVQLGSCRAVEQRQHKGGGGQRQLDRQVAGGHCGRQQARAKQSRGSQADVGGSGCCGSGRTALLARARLQPQCAQPRAVACKQQPPALLLAAAAHRRRRCCRSRAAPLGRTRAGWCTARPPPAAGPSGGPADRRAGAGDRSTVLKHDATTWRGPAAGRAWRQAPGRRTWTRVQMCVALQGSGHATCRVRGHAGGCGAGPRAGGRQPAARRGATGLPLPTPAHLKRTSGSPFWSWIARTLIQR